MTFTCENGLNRRFFVNMLLLRPPTTAYFAKSDHLWKTLSTRIAGRCESAGDAKATTRLYPARFSTPGFTPRPQRFFDFGGCPVRPCLERRIRLTNRPRRVSCSLWSSDTTESAARTRGDNVGFDAMNDESRHDGA